MRLRLGAPTHPTCGLVTGGSQLPLYASKRDGAGTLCTMATPDLLAEIKSATAKQQRVVPDANRKCQKVPPRATSGGVPHRQAEADLRKRGLATPGNDGGRGVGAAEMAGADATERFGSSSGRSVCTTSSVVESPRRKPAAVSVRQIR